MEKLKNDGWMDGCGIEYLETLAAGGWIVVCIVDDILIIIELTVHETSQQ